MSERLQINPGAAELIQACKAAGMKVLLVSGGFTYFADRVKERLGIDFARSNILEMESGPNCGALTGRLVTSAGATFATAPKNAARCWKWPACWA